MFLTLFAGIGLLSAQSSPPAPPMAAAPAGEEAARFPAPFLGRWDLTRARCRSSDSRTAITVHEHEIRGAEDTSYLQTIEALDDLAIRVVVDNESAEREITLAQTLRLSRAPVSLRIETGGRTVRYVNCNAVARQAG